MLFWLFCQCVSPNSDEYQKDFDNFPHQPPITNLTGTWIRGAGAGFHIDQRGCTAGIIGTLTVDGKESRLIL
ncbi:hypothetical protein [Nostoc sp.]|uniref:hypothetical protein n=1 Tax=Nostoc sp. TaxID=1180 RepID=UPI002FF63D63